jgi:hypothetical protein
LILALLRIRDHHCCKGQQDAEELSMGVSSTSSARFVSNLKEVAMYRCLATITGTAVILAATMLVSGRAEARGGGTISNASEYAYTQKTQPVRISREARRHDFGITEYSSSSAPASAKTTSPKR